MAAINRPLPQARRGLPLPLDRGAINWWVVGALLIFGVAAVLPVLQSSTATSRGFDMQRLQAEQVRVQGEIRLLESEVAALSSLARIEQRAAELGLVPGVAPFYVAVDEPGPAPAKIPSQYLPGSTPETAETEPWWQPILSWVPLWD